MTTNTNTTPGYTMRDAGEVTIAGRRMRVEVQAYDNGRTTTWLHGPRGAVYVLREFLGADTGVRQVISWKSGAPLRHSRSQREVRVLLLGDVIEEIAR